MGKADWIIRDRTGRMSPSASEWPWPHELDALIAAPDSHRLLFENDRVRMLEVVIEPGAREPEHTHQWPSVMIVDRAGGFTASTAAG